MTEKTRKRLHQAAEEIDINLGGLLGSLGDALNDMVARLEDGRAGAVQRETTFDSDRGPVRAQAGIRVRMGAMDAMPETADDRPTPRADPSKTRQAQSRPPQELAYDLFEEDDAWVLTADLPGVTTDQLDLSRSEDNLLIRTTGKRRYTARVPLDGPFDPEQAETVLRNGILDLRIPKADP